MTLQHLLLRYTLAMLTQMAQTAIGNRRHSVDQQLCRRLLLSLDRPGLEARVCECYRLLPGVMAE